MGSEEDQEEFRRRFITRMRDRAPFETFADGMSVADYAEQTWESYFEEPWQQAEGPEACADADMSYWGQE